MENHINGTNATEDAGLLEDAKRMMRLFEGFGEAYGTYDGTATSEVKGKMEIKSTAKTRRSPVTLDLWSKHLLGKTPLGIIPVRDNDTCLWGCIDVDQYGVNLWEITKRLKAEDIPLIVCRSKSGGAHMFLFMAEPVEAKDMQQTLKNIAAHLGYGNCEVFPKQRKVATERGDLGSWLNMPYFGGTETDRYAVKVETGLSMTVLEFLDLAESLQQPWVWMSQEMWRKPTVSSKRPDDPEWGDGPPCMQHLAHHGIPEGMRNKTLFNLATFAKRKFGIQWDETVERWNRTLMDDPLPSAEVQQILKSHEKKEYNYACKEHPLSAHCNSSLCRTRKYGVGGDDDYPVVSGLSVLDTEPPLWFLDVDEYRMELTTDQLSNYKSFHRLCLEKLFKCYRMMKQDEWYNVIRPALLDVTKIEASKEVGQTGQFYELLEEFVTNRYAGTTREELLLGKPYLDEEDGRYYFRLKDLCKFLENAGFKIYSRAHVVTRVKSMGGGQKFFNIKHEGTNTWWIPAVFRPMPSAPLPPLEREPI